MASISQGLVLSTAMLLSSTLLYVAFSRHKITPSSSSSSSSSSSFQIHHSNKPTLRSCLYSEEKKREKKKNKKKVKFAENVKEGRERSSEKRVSSRNYNCRNETSESGGMPANRIALYNGILRDRVHKMECSY